MNLFDILLTLILVLLFVFIIVNLLSNRPKKVKSAANLYSVALTHMLHNENEAAIKCFKEVVRKDTENIDAYINLGIVLRQTGKINNAIRIHQNLLYRQELTALQRLEILRNLAEDYIQLNDRVTALKYVNQMLDIDNNNLWAIEKTYMLNRDLGNWEKASEYLEKALLLKSETNNRLLALYKVQEGLVKYRAGEYHDARLIFRKALKIDPDCEAACYYIAKSYIEDKREMDSVEWWVKFADIAPEKATLVFEHLQTILYNLGYFGNIESFYQNLLHKRPNDPASLIALARFYAKKGDIKQATVILENLLENHPDSITANITLCKLLIAQNNLARANEILNNLVESIEANPEYYCTKCGNRLKEIVWICPVCGAADTYFQQP